MAEASGASKPRLFPSTRFSLAILSFLGCMVLYMLRTSLSLAIVCMVQPNNATKPESKCPVEVSALNTTVALLNATSAVRERDFSWTSDEQGSVLGAFFWGYLGSQVLGGMAAARFGAKRIILYCIVAASVLTLISPQAARFDIWALFVLRVIIGFLQGGIFPAMHSMWSVWAPPQESSVLTSVSYAGTQFGNIIVLPLSGFLCEYGPDGGWASIFYLLGLIGLAWTVLWALFMADRPATHPRISEEERHYILSSQEAAHGATDHSKPPPTPWKAMLTSLPVWACWFGHFAGDWGAYAMLVSLPSFLSDVVGLDISSLGIVAAIPYIAYFIVINIGGFAADAIRQRGLLSTINMRRVAMIVALGGQAIFLVLSTYCGCGQEVLVIFYIVIAMGLSGLQFSGFVVNYIDIAPAYSGTIMGIGNTLACLGGIISPKIVGFIVKTQSQSEWQTVMWVHASILLAGTTIFCIFAKGEVQPWAKGDAAKGAEVEMQALNKPDDKE